MENWATPGDHSLGSRLSIANCQSQIPQPGSVLNSLRPAISGAVHKAEPHHRDPEAQRKPSNLKQPKVPDTLNSSVTLWWVLLGTGDPADSGPVLLWRNRRHSCKIKVSATGLEGFESYGTSL